MRNQNEAKGFCEQHQTFLSDPFLLNFHAQIHFKIMTILLEGTIKTAFRYHHEKQRRYVRLSGSTTIFRHLK